MNVRATAAHIHSRDGSTVSLADDVRYYLELSPRQLPSRYLYDALGSALFEAICELPWYRITRAEVALLAQHRDQVFAHFDRVSTIVELGSGNGEKLRTLLRTPSRRGTLAVHTIDVSAAALRATARALSDLDGVQTVTHETTYEDGLDALAAEPRVHGQALALFLGSNIGNFDPPGTEALLRSMRAALTVGDGLLIGADLVKPEAELLLAYNDPLGVTAAFNRNLLVRINRELGGTFDIQGFDHRALWNESKSRVEMHLVSRRVQKIRIEGVQLEIDFSAGEPIWTESSYKFRPDELIARIEATGFRCMARWIDEESRFALILLRAI